MYPYNIVNVVCSAQLVVKEGKTLEDLFPFADKIYNHRPTMAIFKRSGMTIMVFTSFKCRIMGLPIVHGERKSLNDLMKMASSILRQWICEIKEDWGEDVGLIDFTFLTSTMTHKIPSLINFHKNQHCLNFDLELFCGAKFTSAPPSTHVNVFSTGQVVATGLKSDTSMRRTIHQLYSLLHLESASFV